MAGAPEVGPVQLSPDGKWRWDGTRWVPTQPQVTTRRRSRAWMWVAGCATLVVLTALGAGGWIYFFVQGVKQGSNTCLPSDFPRYPGAVYADFSFDLNGAYPGLTCHALFDSNDAVAKVTAFYQSALSTGAWQVTPIENQADTVTFQRAKSDAPFGTVQFAAGNSHTEITVVLYSSTCLPLNFPRYTHASFGGQYEGLGGASPGPGCHVVLVTNDSVATVTAFYQRELNSGRWQVTSSASGRISWRLTNGKRTDASGTVTIALSNDRTEIQVSSYP